MKEEPNLSPEEALNLARKVESWDWNFPHGGYRGQVTDDIKATIKDITIFRKKYELEIFCDNQRIGKVRGSQSREQLSEIYSAAETSYKKEKGREKNERGLAKIAATERARQLAKT